MGDDALDAIDANDFWLDDSALDADSTPVQSLDFELLLGDEVPRDGLQRPLLTSGSPVRTPVPRRANRQPINVTHIHQTVVQQFGPVQAACPTTVAEGTSGLSCLESALAVPQGSVYKPASRWKHRSKPQVAAGMAPHVHDGAIAFGTSMPAPLHTPMSDVVAEADCLDMIATPAVYHVPTADSVSAATPPSTQHVRDVLARMIMQKHEHIQTHTSLVTPTAAPPAAQVGGGPVAEAIARHFAVHAERGEGARAAAQVERDACAAKARLLASAGWHDKAAAIMAAAPTPVPAPAPMLPASDGVISLRPANVRSTNSSAIPPAQEAAVGAWRGSIVGASALRPPPAGEVLTPVQVAVAGVVDLPPGERRARIASLAAAARIVAYMSAHQINTLLGRPASLTATGPAIAYITAQAIHTIGFGWAAGTIDGARRTWIRLIAFAQRTNAMAGLDKFYFHGFIVAGFLSAVDAEARADYKRKNPSKPKHAMDAKGDSARGGQAASCLFLARNLTFPIQVDCKAVTLISRAARRRTTKQAPAMGPRLIYILAWLTEHGDSQWVRCHAAGWLATVHFALRLINAQRSCIISMVGDVVRGSCDLDAKITSGERNGRPMWAHRYDMRGRDLWVHLLLQMRDAPPRAPPLQQTGAEVEDPHYLIRDTNAADGDPTCGKATAWVDWPLVGQRAQASLRALAQLSPWALPREVAMEKTGHSGKHDLVCVSRAGGDSQQDTNEIGKWSGSLAQSTDLASATAAVAMHARHGGSSSEQDSAELAMACLYSAETVEEIVPAIMRRQIERLQALVISPGVDALPAKGGWRHIQRRGAAAAPSDAQPGTQPITIAHSTSTAQPRDVHAQVVVSPRPTTVASTYTQPGVQYAPQAHTASESATEVRRAPPPASLAAAKRMRHASASAQRAIVPYQPPPVATSARDSEQRQLAVRASLPSSRTRGKARETGRTSAAEPRSAASE